MGQLINILKEIKIIGGNMINISEEQYENNPLYLAIGYGTNYGEWSIHKHLDGVFRDWKYCRTELVYNPKRIECELYDDFKKYFLKVEGKLLHFILKNDKMVAFCHDEGVITFSKEECKKARDGRDYIEWAIDYKNKN